MDNAKLGHVVERLNLWADLAEAGNWHSGKCAGLCNPAESGAGVAVAQQRAPELLPPDAPTPTPETPGHLEAVANVELYADFPEPLRDDLGYLHAALSWYDGSPANADVHLAWLHVTQALTKALTTPATETALRKSDGAS